MSLFQVFTYFPLELIGSVFYGPGASETLTSTQLVTKTNANFVTIVDGQNLNATGGGPPAVVNAVYFVDPNNYSNIYAAITGVSYDGYFTGSFPITSFQSLMNSVTNVTFDTGTDLVAAIDAGGFGPTNVTSGSITIADGTVPTFSVAQLGALPTMLAIDGGYAIADTAANLSSYLDGGNSTNVDSITITDNQTLTVNNGVNFAALALLRDANGAPYTFDYDANGAYLDDATFTLLEPYAATGHLLAVNQHGGGSISFTPAQASSIILALKTVSGGWSLNDSAQNIVAMADQVSNWLVDDNLTNFAATTSNGSGAFPVTAAQYVHIETTDSALAAKIGQFAISDTAANISANLAQFQTYQKIAGISVTDSGIVAVTSAQITSDAYALGFFNNSASAGSPATSYAIWNDLSADDALLGLTPGASIALGAGDWGDVSGNPTLTLQGGNRLVVQDAALNPLYLPLDPTANFAHDTFDYVWAYGGSPEYSILEVGHNLAAAKVETNDPLLLGRFHVGAIVEQALSLSNIASADSTNTGTPEALDASIGATSGDATGSGSVSLLAAGSTNSSGLDVGVDASQAGLRSGAVTLAFDSDGAGIDSAGRTPLASQTVDVAADVYRLAAGAVTAPANVILHVGQGDVTESLTIANTAAADGYSENLDADVTGTSGGLESASGQVSDLAAGASNDTNLSFTVSTATAGVVTGDVEVDETSDGTNIDGLGVTALGAIPTPVSVTVDNYAAVAIQQNAGPGALTYSGDDYTLNLGDVSRGSSALVDYLDISNDVAGPADALSGVLAAVNASGQFVNSGLGVFTDVGAGAAAPLHIVLNTNEAGHFDEVITLDATGSNGSGYSGSLGTYTLDVVGDVVAPTTPYDFTGVGMSDILFRNASTGETYLWDMDGTSVAAGAPTSTQVGSNWQIEGVGDFNGDGKADLLWVYDNAANAADPLNGISYLSLQNGTAATSGSGVVEQLSTNWRVAGIGDFTGSGVSDILYRYENASNASDPLNGETYINMMNGSQIGWSASGFTSLQLPISEWSVAAVADFNGSGQDAILWRYDDTASPFDPLNGTLYEWQMNGTQVASQGLISQQTGSPNWQVEGTGDFTGSGNADILLRYENAANSADPLNGETEIDFMNGTTVTSVQLTSQQVDNSWQVAGIGDYNGDGKADILWQNASTGATYIWEMNGANVIGGGMTSEQTGLGWTVQNGVHIQG